MAKLYNFALLATEHVLTSSAQTDTFFWTSDSGLYMESRVGGDQYTATLLENRLQADQARLFHPTAQPTPVPLTPPSHLQVCLNTLYS